MHKRFSAFCLSLSFMLSLFSLSATGQTPDKKPENKGMVPEKYVEGKHYQVLENPITTRDKNKVEVVEIFWYGCGHCHNFESLFKIWSEKQPAYVDIVRMPAIWNKTMELHARAFYTEQALNKFDEIHQPFFDALIIGKKKLHSQKAIRTFFEQFGVKPDAFDDAFDSFGVNSQVQIAKSRTRGYKVRGTPEVIINGKYRLSVSQLRSHQKVLDVAAFLIEKEHKAMTANKKLAPKKAKG